MEIWIELNFILLNFISARSCMSKEIFIFVKSSHIIYSCLYNLCVKTYKRRFNNCGLFLAKYWQQRHAILGRCYTSFNNIWEYCRSRSCLQRCFIYTYIRYFDSFPYREYQFFPCSCNSNRVSQNFTRRTAVRKY